ncbi:COP23 domain-containing protein [Thermocoleostomius sinensis]|uniref:COP23 domain-containing protein n=1 Tax=Thermocoleostomius sinensis A174 TaxID=2016057 RepID=A0A9E8ZFE8_9CYAN|nr:COP23 domain-containing protein [Thermocoleostomius sinensis]WAL60368.1 COP23 domain-containing protein [Thermocoleostomius sinensis A174]
MFKSVLNIFTIIGFVLSLTIAAIALSPQPGRTQTADGFLCDQDGNERSGGFPVVMAISRGQRIHLLTVTDNTQLPPFDDPIARCNQIVARFQNAFIEGGADVFSYLTFGYVNNQPVLCVPMSAQDRQNGICQANDVLITFRSEQRGCLFIPAFLENLAMQNVGGIASNTNFEAMRDLCRQQFSDLAGQSDAQIQAAFRALTFVR